MSSGVSQLNLSRRDLGQAVQAYLDRGELVPDEVVLDMLREAMVAAKAAGGGYVLDGIPRNMHQARAAYLIGRELEMTADVHCTCRPTTPKSCAGVVPEQARLPVDLTGLGDAFGATDPAGTSG